MLAGLLSSLAGVLLTLSSPKQTEVTSPEWVAEPGEAPASAVLDWPEVRAELPCTAAWCVGLT